MKAKKVIALIASGAIVLTGCTGGGGSAKTPSAQTSAVDTSNLKGEITFQTWNLKNPKFEPYFNKLISDFEGAHPGTKIKWVDQPDAGYEDKVLQQANSGNLPDVVNLPEGFALTLAKTNNVLDLKKAAPDSISQYVDQAVEAYSVDGATYGYPWYLGTDVSMWRQDLLEKGGITTVPTTLDEYLNAAASAAEKTNGEVRLIDSLPKVELMGGVKIFDGTKFVFNNDDNVKLLERYADLYQKKAIADDVLAAGDRDNAKLFAAGKIAYTTGTAGSAANIAKDSPTLLQNVKVSPRVTPPPLFVQGLSVSAKSANQPLALAFAQYATNTENQLNFVKLAVGFMPGTKEGAQKVGDLYADADNKLVSEAAKIAGEHMSEAKLARPTQYTDEMNTYTTQQMTLAVTGKMSAKDALDEAVRYANDNLAK